MNKELYLLGQVSAILDTPPHRIVYLLSTRQVPEPIRIGGRRVFDIKDVQRIAQKLDCHDAEGERGLS